MTPMPPLTDDQLDAGLGSFLKAEAETIGARAQGELIAVEALRRRLGGSPSGRSWILLAAALLLAIAAAVGLTAGAVTVLEQATSPYPMPDAKSSAIRTERPCEISLPGTWVVYTVWEDGAGRQNELVVHQDGAVYERIDPGPWEQGPLTVRLLTAAGVELVREAVLSSVEGSGCPEVRVPGARPHHVVARSASGMGSVAGVDWGMPWEAPLLAATGEHQAVATTLGARLEDLAAWLPPSAWVDATARPYVGQWLINVQQRYRSPDSTAPVGSDPTDLGVIGDYGVAFGPYGVPVIGTPDGPPNAATPIADERCQVTDAESAAEIRNELRRSGAVPPGGTEPGWRYTVQGDPTYDIIVRLVALRPGELSCLDWRSDVAAPVATPAPSPQRVGPTVVETRRTDQSPVCWWLDLAWSRPPTPRTLQHQPCSR